MYSFKFLVVSLLIDKSTTGRHASRIASKGRFSQKGETCSASNDAQLVVGVRVLDARAKLKTGDAHVENGDMVHTQ